MKKMHIIFHLSLIGAAVLITSCHKQNSKANSGSVSPTVYIAGFTGTVLSTTTGAYWKNGVLTNIPTTGQINGIIVKGNDTYLLTSAGYWKNSTYFPLDSAMGTTSFFVDGTDVYVSGYTTTSLNTATAECIYWKNGKLVNLTQNIADVTAGNTNSIFVSNGDVYVAGIIAINFRDEYAVYWKNGAIQTVPDGYNAKAIAVSGDNVYIAGTSLNNGDVYWKNGVEQTLGSPIINSMVVYNGDVYITGFTTDGPDRAAYWKNGSLNNLPSAWQATSIAVSGSDVFVSGNSNDYAIYWKNGVVDTLGIGGATSIYIDNQ